MVCSIINNICIFGIRVPAQFSLFSGKSSVSLRKSLIFKDLGSWNRPLKEFISDISTSHLFSYYQHLRWLVSFYFVEKSMNITKHEGKIYRVEELIHNYYPSMIVSIFVFFKIICAKASLFYFVLIMFF